MRRIMLGMGVTSKKVWIQGGLRVSTANNPNCEVRWGWHVAPTLCVRGPGLFRTTEMVIDPALFSAPVSVAGWQGVQGDPGATLTPSDGSVFYLWGTGSGLSWGSYTDPAYSQTNSVLAFYRLQLQARALSASGPPPYACP